MFELIGFINTFLTVLFLCVCFFTLSRAILAYCFFTALFTMSTLGLSKDSPSFYLYYIGAAFNDLLILMALNRLAPFTKTNRRLTYACLMSIGINSVGWVIWMLYEPPNIYNLLCTIVYMYAIVVMFLDGDTDNVGIRELAYRQLKLYCNRYVGHK